MDVKAKMTSGETQAIMKTGGKVLKVWRRCATREQRDPYKTTGKTLAVGIWDVLGMLGFGDGRRTFSHFPTVTFSMTHSLSI